MNNDSQRILEMLSEGKITVEEAERLLEALGAHGPTYQLRHLTLSPKQRLVRTVMKRRGTRATIERLSAPVPA